jgi:hypothetical protein
MHLPVAVAVAVAVDTILPHGVLLPAAVLDSMVLAILGAVTGNEVRSHCDPF